MNEIALQRIEAARIEGATHLSLGFLGLETLPEELKELTQLRELHLAGNKLEELPNWISRLDQIETIDLGRNSLSSIPAAIRGLVKLRRLDLDYNVITSVPSWYAEMRVSELYMGRNPLEGLEGLVIAANRLKALGLDHSTFERLIAAAKLPKLKSLSLRLEAPGMLDPAVFGLCQLTQLSVSGGLLALPEMLGRLNKLRRLLVWNNELTELPDVLGKLTELRFLGVGENRLAILPDSLGQLTKLQELDVSDNRLAVLPDSLCLVTELRYLNVGGNRLSALPNRLDSLTKLQGIFLWGNQLTELPESLGALTKLQYLNASRNHLTKLPEGLGRLQSLEYLGVSDNHLVALPGGLGLLTKLRDIDVSRNHLTALPDSIGSCLTLTDIDAFRNDLIDLPAGLLDLKLRGLWLQENSRLGLSRALLGKYVDPSERDEDAAKDPRAILDAFFSARALDGQPLNEVKLVLVGRGAAGKTSIARQLTKGTFRQNCKETQGIDITRWKLDCAGQKVNVNIWDFAGQVVTHSTHQFFLSESSVYVLVLTGREDTQKTDAEYWLRLIRAFAGDGQGNVAPVIVVLNKYEQHPFKVDRNALREKYPFIADFIETDCKSELGMQALRDRLAEVVAGMSIVRQPFKLSWWKIKQRLEKAQRKQHYFPYSTFRDICSKEGETEPARQRFLADVFHVLGVALNYGADERLREATVLNPRWVTESIYRLLREGVPDDGSAELSFERVRHVLKDEPEEMQRYLVELMRRFDLAFPLNEGGDRWLVPQRLPAEQPDLGEEWRQVSEATRLRFIYPVVPEGLLPRFISRTYPLSEATEEGGNALPRWANGVVLADGDAKALVRVDVEEKRVNIVVTGEREARLSLLGVIQADFRTIHNDIDGLGEIEELELEDNPGVFVPVRSMRADELLRQHSSTPTEKGTITFDPVRQLNRLSDPRAREERQWRPRVFISYSSCDARQKDNLLTRLKPLCETRGLLEIWHDRCIAPGGDWDGEVRAELERADVVLFLVSSRFMASDYIRGVEVQRAVERADGGMAMVVPIILEQCDWTSESFGKFNAIPRKGDPIRDAKPQRNAWHEVAQELRQLFGDMILRRTIFQEGTEQRSMFTKDIETLRRGMHKEFKLT